MKERWAHGAASNRVRLNAFTTRASGTRSAKTSLDSRPLSSARRKAVFCEPASAIAACRTWLAESRRVIRRNLWPSTALSCAPLRRALPRPVQKPGCGSAPSCARTESRLPAPQCSTILPSRTRMASTLSKLIFLPVALIPRKSPRCVP